jgi:DNA polymerase III alpha subunit
MICRADTIGVFQIESRAQMSMLPRLKPRCYLRSGHRGGDRPARADPGRHGPSLSAPPAGQEPVSFPKPELEAVLGKTLGVPLFQEQAMNIAIVAGGFSPGEADKLRRAMATFRRVGTIGSFQTKMVEGMVRNGYERDFAEHCFRQIEGFGEYGFPGKPRRQLRAAGLCLLLAQVPLPGCVLRRAPQLPADGLLRPGAAVRDAREHGVEIRPVDINCSGWDGDAGAGPEAAAALTPASRDEGCHEAQPTRCGWGCNRSRGSAKPRPCSSWRTAAAAMTVSAICGCAPACRAAPIEQLAEADCFRSIGLDRRDALWAVKALDPLSSAERLPLFALADSHDPAEGA